MSRTRTTDTKAGGGLVRLPPRTWRGRAYVNARLRVAAIRGFRRDWFVKTSDPRIGPNPHHIASVNARLRIMRHATERNVRRLGSLMRTSAPPLPETFKEVRHDFDRRVVAIQNVWDFFFDIFSQRHSIYSRFLRRCDNVVDECYVLVFRRLALPKPWTKTPPLCYLDKGFSPATIRRGVGLRTRGPLSAANPFPVIKIPYDRIANPWTLTSLHHEVSHDIHGDVPNLWRRTQVNIHRALRRAGMGRNVAQVWGLWHKETLADLLGILLGGPAVVRSMMDQFSRPRRIVMRFRPHDSHPTPYLRIFINTHALRRLGFPQDAAELERKWKARYPLAKGHRIPDDLLKTAPRAIPIVVRTLLWTPYPELGGKRLVDIVNYSREAHSRVLAGAQALIEGRTPTGLPKRHVISAGVYAFERNPDKARTIRRALFKALDRRPITEPAPVSPAKRPNRPVVKRRTVVPLRPRRLASA